MKELRLWYRNTLSLQKVTVAVSFQKNCYIEFEVHIDVGRRVVYPG